MNKSLVLLAAAAAALASPAFAATPAPTQAAACQLHVDTAAGSWIIDGYDPFGGNPPTGTFDLVFRNEGNAECRFFPVFETDAQPLGLRAATGNAAVSYSLEDLFGNYDATPIAGRTVSRATRRQVVIEPGGQQIVRYQLAVLADAIDGDGLFSQHLIVDAEDSNGNELAQRQIIVGINVLPSAVMGLSGAFRPQNGRIQVDLGELSPGVPAVPLDLYVQSTRNFRLTVESLNGGKLKLQGTDWSVPYQLIVDGRSMPLSSTGTYNSRPRSGLRRDTLPIGFQIGDVDDRRAGTYTDVITVSIAAQ